MALQATNFTKVKDDTSGLAVNHITEYQQQISNLCPGLAYSICTQNYSLIFFVLKMHLMVANSALVIINI